MFLKTENKTENKTKFITKFLFAFLNRPLRTLAHAYQLIESTFAFI